MASERRARRLRLGVAAAAALLAVAAVAAVVVNDDGDGGDSARQAAPTTVAGAPPGAASGAAPSAAPTAGGSPGSTRSGTAARQPGEVDGAASSVPGTSPVPAPPPAVDPSGKQWVRVGAVSGNRNAGSAPFRLAGIDTRLVYRSDAPSLSVFLVDEDQGRDATAGFADLECDRPCTGEMILVSPAGSYHLEVETPGGAYEVVVEEYRRPGR